MLFSDRLEKTETVQVISNDILRWIFAAVVTAIGGKSRGCSDTIKHSHILVNVYLFNED